MKNKILYILIIIGIAVLAMAVSFYASINKPALVNDTQVNFLIEPGQGVKQISQNLYEQELIKDKFYFEVYVWLKDWEGGLQAGEYVLNKNMSIKEIARRLSGGEATGQELSVTIIEGWDRPDVDKYLTESKIIVAGEFLENTIIISNNERTEWNFLADAPASATLEGYLFPDTYKIYKDATVNDVIKKMLNNFNSKLTAQMRQEIKKQGKTIFEVITLASIIEKEVMNSEEMKMISDIFLKRLKIGQGLESDATVNFITGKGVTRPSLEDLAIEHPYNTYKHRGLPPGPIANPGINAIKAAIYPTPNQYYYFLTTSEGEVIYSVTYEEHLKNRRMYYE